MEEAQRESLLEVDTLCGSRGPSRASRTSSRRPLLGDEGRIDDELEDEGRRDHDGSLLKPGRVLKHRVEKARLICWAEAETELPQGWPTEPQSLDDTTWAIVVNLLPYISLLAVPVAALGMLGILSMLSWC